MNQYPRDEFDVVPENARREGAHRSFVRLRDPRTGIWTLIVIGLMALVVGAVMFFVVHPQVASVASDVEAGTSQGEGASDQDDAASTGGKSSGADSSAAPASGGASSSGSNSSQQPSESGSAGSSSSASPSTGESSGSTGAANLSTAVGVYNGTGRSGLASGSASSLKNAGYTSVTTANWTKRTSVSAVYYKDAASKATAEAIAKRLKISTVVQTANIPSPVSVVIGTDRSN